MQKQCPWCGKLGARVPDNTSIYELPDPHADGSKCVCRHVSVEGKGLTDAERRRLAQKVGGRYFSQREERWVCCGGCEPKR